MIITDPEFIQKAKEYLKLSRCGYCIKRPHCKNIDLGGECKEFLPPDKNAIAIFGGYYPRCNKCVYCKENCGDDDSHGNCQTYRRDPPDGGYYG